MGSNGEQGLSCSPNLHLRSSSSKVDTQYSKNGAPKVRCGLRETFIVFFKNFDGGVWFLRKITLVSPLEALLHVEGTDLCLPVSFS